jgi:hypothetical protein
VKKSRGALAADGSEPATLRGTARIVSWGLALWGGEQLAASAFAQNTLAMAGVQAALAEWGAGRLGIAWSDPGTSSTAAPPRSATSWTVVGRRIARGASLGFATAALVALAAIATRAAFVAPALAAPAGLSATPLLVGLVVAALGAVRDELLLRGVVLGASRLLPVTVALLACGGAAAAVRLGTDGVVTSALAADALRGVALGGVWVRDRGAWMACAANTAWTWTMTFLLRGGGMDLRFVSPSGADGGTGLVVLAVVAVAALLWALAGCRAARRVASAG